MEERLKMFQIRYVLSSNFQSRDLEPPSHWDRPKSQRIPVISSRGMHIVRYCYSKFISKKNLRLRATDLHSHARREASVRGGLTNCLGDGVSILRVCACACVCVLRACNLHNVEMVPFVGFCRQSQGVGLAGHPAHSHSHHGHPTHLSPGSGGGNGRSPAGGPVVAGGQHLGQPLYQEYAHVRSRAHPVPPPVYVTAAPSQAPAAIQQQQVPTYQGFTPGWVPRHLVDACMCVPIFFIFYF